MYQSFPFRLIMRAETQLIRPAQNARDQSWKVILAIHGRDENGASWSSFMIETTRRENGDSSALDLA